MSMPAAILNTKPTLAHLLQGFAEAPEIEISGIASDSRKIGEGDLFLACAGASGHGLDYVADVTRARAAAIAWDSTTGAAPTASSETIMLSVPDLGQHLGEIANRFYDFPSKAMHVVGVTGTNGKTTVAWLIAQCLEHLGQRCAYLGTLGSGIGEIEAGDGMTTPAAVELHGRFADFRDQGAMHAAMEVSSHALAQNRVDGVFFDSVLFTNLSRDHLDYHGDMQSYAETKAGLFSATNPEHRVINVDSDFGTELADRFGQDAVIVSTDTARAATQEAHVFVSSVDPNEFGSVVRVRSSWGDGEFALPLLGDFNVENAVIVLAFLLEQGVSMTHACETLSQVSAPPGRLQRVVSAANLPRVYVDYAHTPAAIQVALNALRVHCKGKLCCVFGCGGDRDAGKRPLMAQAAEELADRIVITNDNPRTEAPEAIIADVVAGLDNAKAAVIIEDRGAAIAWAIATAGPDDVVLLAGKGHEDYQLLGTERLDFSDYTVAAANLAKRAATMEASK
jgi:UDP-N-acetylmuramoyl-L-alanyl-D-glutamate--2,6-diaminopimelate ligase